MYYVLMYLCLYVGVNNILLVLDIEQLSIHDVKLGVTDAEDVASHSS